MNDQGKTKRQLIAELAASRQRVCELEAELAQGRPAAAALRQRGDSIVLGTGQNLQDTEWAENGRAPVEEAIRQSEQKMRLHVEQTPLAVIEWDLEHRVLKWNPGAERIFGYGQAEATGRHFNFIVPPHARQQVRLVWAALLAKKGGERSTNENLTKDGRTIQCEWYNTPLVDAQGQVIGFASLAEDVTERKRAETAVREAKDFAERLIASMFDGFSVLDAQGVHVQVNDAFCRMTGYAREELIGVGVPHPYWPPEHRQQIEHAFGRTVRGDVGQVEVVFARKNGERFPVLLAPSQVKNAEGLVVNYLATIKDISDQKQAAAELQASERKYRQLYQSIRDGVATVTMAGQIQECNDAYCQMLGYPPEELTALTYQDLTPGKWHRFEEAILRDQTLTRGYSEPYEKEYRRKDGTVFPVELRTYLTTDDNGQATGMWAIIRDITERKRADAALRQARDELEQRVVERTAELTRVNESLKAEQQALRRMVLAGDYERSLITYELHDGIAQQVLAALMLFQSLKLPAQPRSQATNAYRDGMDALRRAAAEARRLMNRLRTPVLDKFGLAEAIHDVIAQLRLPPEAPEIEYCHDVRFQRLEPTLENSLFRIAQESVTNACRHSHSQRVRVELTQQDDEIRLEVQDWGVGFELDQVADNRFGLEGIRERARILGGRLNIRSGIGQGTLVCVTFPAIEAVQDE